MHLTPDEARTYIAYAAPCLALIGFAAIRLMLWLDRYLNERGERHE